jgi:sugar/nucleoside kinase (ribokinase family)
MTQEPPLIDYLAIGHVAKDVTVDGFTLGGSVSYSGRTALAMGLNVAIITSCSESFDLSALEGIQILQHASENTTTFENTYAEGRRTQKISAKAIGLDQNSIPDEWRSAQIVHFAPIAREVDPNLLNHFPSGFIGLTPQGWLREWDSSNYVHLINWETIKDFIAKADAVVLSYEDIQYDAESGKTMADHCRVLAVTKAAQGATVYWKNERYDLPSIKSLEVDSTGAGDIFASAFFIRLYQTNNPVQAGIFANMVAAASITRRGINSTPTSTEINEAGVRAQQ